MTDKKLEAIPLSKREREYVKRIADRDGITEDEAATNLFKSELARRAKKRSSSAKVLSIKRR